MESKLRKETPEEVLQHLVKEGKVVIGWNWPCNRSGYTSSHLQKDSETTTKEE